MPFPSYLVFYICDVAMALWALIDFHRPYNPSSLRLSVSRRRYILGAGVYMAGAAFAFFVAVTISLKSIQYFSGETTDIERLVSVVSVSVVLFFTAMPWLPIFKTRLNAVRRSAQALALFPKAIDQLMGLLDRAKFSPHEEAHRAIVAEVDRYGAPAIKLRETWFARPAAIADEIESIRLRNQDLKGDKTFANAIRKLQIFYDVKLEELSLQRTQLYNEFAKALLAIKILEKQSPVDMDVARLIAGLVEEEAASLLGRYRRIVAEIALSQISSPNLRGSFLKKFGYSVPPRLAVPFWPIVASFVTVFFGMLSPQLILRVLSPRFDHETWSGLADIFVISANQAFILSLSLLWAVKPKEHMNFARPSLKALPKWSYVLFGLCAYFTSASLLQVSFWAFPFLPLAQKSPATYLVLSLFSTTYTVAVALRIDLHLMRRSAVNLTSRLFDAAFLCLTIGSIQLVITNLLDHVVGVPLPRPELLNVVPAWAEKYLSLVDFSEYTLVIACIAFIIGFVVPLTASEAIERESPLRRGSYAGSEPPPSLSRAVVRIGTTAKAEVR